MLPKVMRILPVNTSKSGTELVLVMELSILEVVLKASAMIVVGLGHGGLHSRVRPWGSAFWKSVLGGRPSSSAFWY